MSCSNFVEEAPLPVVDRGKGWLAVDKPAGLSVHNDPGNDVCSRLARFLEGPFADTVAYDPAYAVHPVHRLDRETSGILLLACQREVFNFFADQIARGKARKEYLALVHGKVGTADFDKWAEWRWPLTKGAAGRRSLQGSGARVSCLTRFCVIQTTPRYSLLRCRLLTGRRHQIRRHAALSGHPVLGDRRYGSKRACSYLEQRFGFTRFGLHSALLGIRIPGGNEMRCFKSESLPEDVRRVFESDLDLIEDPNHAKFEADPE